MAVITLRHIIYSLKEEFNLYSDDNIFSDEYLAFLINNIRADYIARTFGVALTKVIPPSLYTKVCLDLVEQKDCEDDIYILESKEAIPAIVNFNENRGLKSINLGSVMIKYLNFVSLDRVPYLSSGRFSNTQLYYSMSADNKFLLISTGYPLISDKVKFSAIFSDPEEAANLQCGDDGKLLDCDFFDAPYPIDDTTLNIVRLTLSQTLFNKLRMPEDKVNDADNTTSIVNFDAKNYGDKVNGRSRRQREED